MQIQSKVLKTICPFQLQIVRLKYFNNDSEIWRHAKPVVS